MWFYNPSRPSDGLPDLVQLAPPQSEPGVDVPGYVEVEYDALSGFIILPDGETILFPPISDPVPDWNIFYLILDNYVQQFTGEKTTLVSLILKMPNLPKTSIPIFVREWNNAVSRSNINQDWDYLKTEAIKYNCNIFSQIDIVTGLLPIFSTSYNLNMITQTPENLTVNGIAIPQRHLTWWYSIKELPQLTGNQISRLYDRDLNVHTITTSENTTVSYPVPWEWGDECLENISEWFQEYEAYVESLRATYYLYDPVTLEYTNSIYTEIQPANSSILPIPIIDPNLQRIKFNVDTQDWYLEHIVRYDLFQIAVVTSSYYDHVKNVARTNSFVLMELMDLRELLGNASTRNVIEQSGIPIISYFSQLIANLRLALITANQDLTEAQQQEFESHINTYFQLELQWTDFQVNV